MNVSAKKEYACLALVELASAYEQGEPLQLRRISDKHGIPSPFLVQIMSQLKAAGVVDSQRGAAGGYRLRIPPDELTLAAVMSVVDGTGRKKETANSSRRRASSVGAVLQEAWEEVERAQRDILDGITLSDLVARAQGRVGNMYYI